MTYDCNCLAIWHAWKKKGECRGTAVISSDRENKSLKLSNQHSHSVKPYNLDVPFLRQHITEKALIKTVNSYVPPGIYMESIVKLVFIFIFV